MAGATRIGVAEAFASAIYGLISIGLVIYAIRTISFGLNPDASNEIPPGLFVFFGVAAIVLAASFAIPCRAMASGALGLWRTAAICAALDTIALLWIAAATAPREPETEWRILLPFVLSLGGLVASGIFGRAFLRHVRWEEGHA